MKTTDISQGTEFNHALGLRPVMPPTANLTARIVSAAMRAPEIIARFSFGQWLRELFADFMLPQPAYALSGMLVMGVVMGFVFAPMLITEDTSASTHMLQMDEGDLP